jgi:hypothetical protein
MQSRVRTYAAWRTCNYCSIHHISHFRSLHRLLHKKAGTRGFGSAKDDKLHTYTGGPNNNSIDVVYAVCLCASYQYEGYGYMTPDRLSTELGVQSDDCGICITHAFDDVPWVCEAEISKL